MKQKQSTAHRQAPAPPAVFGSSTIAELAAQQGVAPVQDIDELVGDFWPEDESADEFLATIRAWRDGVDPSTRS